MKIVENYLQQLFERRHNIASSTIMYHGSIIQNLKVIDPKKWVDAIRETHMATVWASYDKTFAAMFCIDWRKNMQEIMIGTDIGFCMGLGWDDPRHCHDDNWILDDPYWSKNKQKRASAKEYGIKKDTARCKKLRKNPKWHVTVPTRYKKLLMKPCSIYKVQAKQWKVPKVLPQDYPWDWPEAYTKYPARVLEEKKYSTVVEAYKDNGVILIIENLPEYKKWWHVVFSKIKI